MQVQKPTVLDAARVAAELNQLRGANIIHAWSNDSRNRMWLELTNPEIVICYVVEKQYSYIGMTDEIPPDKLKIAPALDHAEFMSAIQVGNDRIVQIHLLNEDRLGRKFENYLTIELMPNHGNAVLFAEDNVIRWSLKENFPEKYKFPSPLKKLTILNLDDVKIKSSTSNPKAILDDIYGLNSRDLINLQIDESSDLVHSLAKLHHYVEQAIKLAPAWLIFRNGEIAGYSLVEPLLNSGESAEEVDSALKMYERYYKLATGLQSESIKLESLLGVLQKEIAHHKAKLRDIELALRAALDAEKFRLYGELILANINELKKGMNSAKLQNFEGQTPEFIELSLDPSKSISTNAEEYFRKYKKAVSSQKILTRRLEASKLKLAILEKILANHADNSESLESELIKTNIIAPKTEKRQKKQISKRLPYRAFKSSGGWDILVGKSNKDNDELTFKIAAKDDFWFHAWQAAGSHTVLRLPNKSAIPDKQALLEAASLAAFFSKARTSSKVPVAYTQVKFVRKPKNFPPGKVLVEKEKQLMVTPANLENFGEKKEF